MFCTELTNASTCANSLASDGGILSGNFLRPPGVKRTILGFAGSLFARRKAPNARSPRADEVLRLGASRSKHRLLSRAWPSPRLFGPEWVRQKHHRQDAHRPAGDYQWPSSL